MNGQNIKKEDFCYYMSIACTSRRNLQDIDPTNPPPTVIDQPNELVPEPEARDAFLCGYINALHKSRTLSPALFAESNENLMSEVEGEISAAFADQALCNIIIATDLSTAIRQFLSNVDENHQIDKMVIADAFIGGYKTALVCHRRYDHCLFMEGYTLETTIFGDILAAQTKEDNARHSTARTIFGKFRNHKGPTLRMDAKLTCSEDQYRQIMAAEDAGASVKPT